MSTIQRYELTLAEEQTLLLPQGARLLSVGDYNGTLALWALVNIEKPKREYTVRILGTGQSAPEGLFTYSNAMDSYLWEFLGTVRTSSLGARHVFYRY